MNRIEKRLRKIARETLLKWREEGRYISERKIFPRIVGKKVLLVGVAHYTADYPKRLGKNEVWSIDIDPEVSKFGAKRHITGSISEANKFYSENFFDVVLLLGVFGYGLNDNNEAEKAMKACHSILKKNGALVIQWSDILGKNPINPKNLKNFQLFEEKSMFGYSSPYITKDKKRVWNFLLKR